MGSSDMADYIGLDYRVDLLVEHAAYYTPE